MALPITRGESSPIFKYNAKAGRCSIDDQSLTSITMIVDMDNAEVGWVFFGEGAAPDFQMVRIADLEAGADFPAKPDARDGQGRPTYKRGFRCMVKVPDKLANGSSVREWASNSRATCDGFDKIHDLWLAGRDNNPGRLPMVKMTGVEEVKGQHGSNYVPLFTIRDWIDRPADMTAKPNGATKPPMSGAKSVIIADDDGDDNDVEFS